MQKVLIPTDFSENSMNAIRYAMELLKYQKSEFLIINAFADEVYENTMEMTRDFFEEFKEKVKQATDRALQKVIVEMLTISPNPKHNYEYRSIFGSLVDAANDLADSENIDLIVMGTKGKTDNRDVTFGSETLQVIKYVKVPVLAIPQRFHKNTPEHILFPTDYIVPHQRREIKLLSTVARDFGATLNYLHICKFKKLSHRQLDNRDFLEACTLENQPTFLNIEGDDITIAINSFIKERDINLLVMVNNRHSYMESILYRSTIERIGLQIDIPFLVLQNLAR